MRLLPIGLFLFALAVRLLPWHSVYRPTGALPFGNDAFYHLRRIRYSLAKFPAVLDSDAFINFPRGGQPIWPPTLDWLIAALLRLLGVSDAGQVERLAMWIPPLVGAATVVLAYGVARRLHSRAVALLAAGILCVLPAHFYYSQLGFLDHHVVVAFVTTWMLAAALSVFRASPAGRGGDRAGLRRSGVLGLALAVAVVLWPGALLHVAILELACVVRLLLSHDAAQATALSRRFALANLVACAGVAPLCLGNEWERWGSFSALVLSNFQPVAFLMAGLAFGCAGLLWRAPPCAASRRSRALSAAAVGLTLAGLLFAAVPEAGRAVADAWAWLAKQERFQAAVNESASLFGDFGAVHRARAVGFLSFFVYAVPAAIVLLWRESRGRADRQLFLWWTLALFAATAVQWRFMNSFSVAHAILVAWAVVSLRALLVSRLVGQRRAAWATVGLALAAGWALEPALVGYRSHLRNVRQALAGEAPLPSAAVRRRELVVESARWLRENAAPLQAPGYSVLASWSDGHILKYSADRPVVQDNFGDDVGSQGFELAEQYFAAQSEAAALAAGAPARVGYVLVRSTGSGHSRGEYAAESMFHRLYRPGSVGGETEGSAALERHRLVYESIPDPAGKAPQRPYCALWEVVEGARLEGAADPAALVELSLSLESRGQGRRLYRATTRADASGRYAFRVAYSNQQFSPDLRAAPQTILSSGGVEASVAIPEAAVRRGLAIRAPSLRRVSLPPEAGRLH